MKVLLIIAFAVAFVGFHWINIALGSWNAKIVRDRIIKNNRNQIEHFAWFAGYCIICAPFYWLFNIYFSIALIPLHLSIFAPAYNHFRGLTEFNLSRSSKAISEKFMVWIGLKSIEWPCIIAEGVAVGLFITSLYKYFFHG